jgi:hypothetical protein
MPTPPTVFAHIPGDILGIAGYYTADDSTQHVIAATTDGNLYEVHWNQNVPPTAPLGFAHFHVPICVSGFYSPDDKSQHAIVATSDTTLHEVYFQQANAPHHRDHFIHLDSLYGRNGMAGFYSPGDNFRHVVTVDTFGNLQDVTFNAQQPPTVTHITTPFTNTDIASLSGFLATNDSSRHIIFALTNATGDVYDISFPDQSHVPSSTGSNPPRTQFNQALVNVTAYFSPDTNYSHIVALTTGGILYDHAYNIVGDKRSTQLTSTPISNVADITSYYSAYDNIRHVIFATTDGNLHEITYTSQG